MSTPAIVMVDDDDPMIGGYIELELPEHWALLIRKRTGLAELYNEFFFSHETQPWYGFLADDVMPVTYGWDQRLIAAAAEDGMAFGDDGINGEKFGTHFVLGGDLVRRVGVLALPGLSRLYIDTVWNDYAKNIGVRRYLAHVKLTHHHFSNGMALMDQTYRKDDRDADRAIYTQWREDHYVDV